MWDPRSSLDTIIQSSTVDLFHACAVAVAPLPRSTSLLKAMAGEPLLGTIQFTSASMTGAITLAVPLSVFSSASTGSARQPLGTDWVRELTNQLLGRIKKRLAQFQVNLQAGLPSLATLETLQRLQTGNRTPGVYEFRTLRGEVVVVLDAIIDYSALAYTGALELANEGDIILF